MVTLHAFEVSDRSLWWIWRIVFFENNIAHAAFATKLSNKFCCIYISFHQMIRLNGSVWLALEGLHGHMVWWPLILNASMFSPPIEDGQPMAAQSPISWWYRHLQVNESSVVNHWSVYMSVYNCADTQTLLLGLNGADIGLICCN